MDQSKLYRTSTHPFFVILLISFLYGCGGSTTIKGENDPSYLYQKERKAETMNQKILLEFMKRSATERDDYVIGPEDLLEIDVFQAEELRRTVRVSAKGYIGLPLTGQIKVEGLSATQVEEAIAVKLRKYMEDPLVTVYIKEYRAQKISVVGAVGLPQVYTVSGQRYLLDLIAMAGGITKDAGDICYVLRPVNHPDKTTSGNKVETMVIDLNALLVEGNPDLNIPVFSGDVINIPKAGMIFVDGAVEKPGAFTLQGKITLVQAIAMAGGIKFEADRSDVRVFRDNGKGEREVMKVDYGEIREGKVPDPILLANDIVIVPKSGVKNFFSGFINTIKGIFSFGKAL